MEVEISEEGELLIAPENNMEKSFIKKVLKCKYEGDTIRLTLRSDIFGDPFLTTTLEE